MEKFAFDENCTVELDLSAVSDLISAFESTEISQSRTLTSKNVGKVEGLDLQSTYGRTSCSSVAINRRRSFGENFYFTASCELSNDSITASLMITEKTTGVSFGIEHKLTFAALKKNGFRVVIKVPVCGIEFVLKFDVATVARVVSVIIHALNAGGSSLGSYGGCGQISMVADFCEDKIYEDVTEYEGIEEYAEVKKSPSEDLGTHQLVREIPVAEMVVRSAPIVLEQAAVHVVRPAVVTVLDGVAVAVGAVAAGAAVVGGITACLAFPWAAPVILPSAAAVVRNMHMH